MYSSNEEKSAKPRRKGPETWNFPELQRTDLLTTSKTISDRPIEFDFNCSENPGHLLSRSSLHRVEREEKPTQFFFANLHQNSTKYRSDFSANFAKDSSREGIEPSTSRLTVARSNQLSYPDNLMMAESKICNMCILGKLVWNSMKTGEDFVVSCYRHSTVAGSYLTPPT